MSAARESLGGLLSAPELERLDALVAAAPTSATAATWLETRGLLWVGAKVGGELIGWLLTPAGDEAEARVMGETLAALLAQACGPMREARQAAAEAIRKAAH